MKGLLFTIAGLLALAAVVCVVWQRPNTDDLNTPPETVRRPTVSPQPGPRIVQANPETEAPSIAAERGSPTGDTAEPSVHTTFNDSQPIPHDVPFEQIKSELWQEVQTNPPELLERGDPAIDAEMAYRLYMFYGNCTMAPRTGHEIDRRLERLVMRAERAGQRSESRGSERFLEGLEQRADNMMDFYEMCLTIPQDIDTRLEAVQWMTEAVELGHEIAQVQFYDKAMGFLLRPDVFGELPPLVMARPGLIDAFKSTARYALSEGMENGHPEAYLAMSQAIFEGLLYRKDPVMALAYARTAEMKAAQSQVILDQVGNQKQRIAQHLTREQISEAEQLALDLWKESNQ